MLFGAVVSAYIVRRVYMMYAYPYPRSVARGETFSPYMYSPSVLKTFEVSPHLFDRKELIPNFVENNLDTYYEDRELFRKKKIL